MNDEQSVNTEENFLSKGWPSIVIVGAIFSVVSFVVGLFFGYQEINSEPSGSLISPILISSIVICLVTAFAGILAVWHYTKEVSPKLKMGQGALIGFLTGAVIVIFSVVLNELWMFIDPEYTEKVLEATIANIDQMDLPADARDDMIDAMAESIGGEQSIWRQIFLSVPITGMINLVTALIGVKLFAEKEDTF